MFYIFEIQNIVMKVALKQLIEYDMNRGNNCLILMFCFAWIPILLAISQFEIDGSISFALYGE